MCEILAVAFPTPQPFARVRRGALALERLGIAGFGWGVAWVRHGEIAGHRDPGRLEDDRPRGGLDQVHSNRFLVHRRRPSQLTTVGLADSQPFVDAPGSLAFAHNGRFDLADQMRPLVAGQLAGKADSEVGFRLFERLRGEPVAAATALAETHRRLGGSANLACLAGDGDLLVYAGNPGNALWQFRLEDATVASTALHSADAALISRCLPAARAASRVGQGTARVVPPGICPPVGSTDARR
ncbi:MAG TPA: hypothetical protein VMW47_12780 [Verrucomicrobiae bacterium]|nr:hypothetical protein [Verrucomicrobiae bacterium]